jgi:hypothetical protein
VDELKIRVAKFLPCSERARVSKVSRSVRTACNLATTVHFHVTGAIMPVTVSRPFHLIWNLLLYGVYNLRIAGNLSPKAQQVLAQGPNVETLHELGLHADIAVLNASVFSGWKSDLSARPDSGVHHFLKDTAELNPDVKLAQYLPQIQHWPQSRIHGCFWAILDRADGTVVVSESGVYLIQGVGPSLGQQLMTAGLKLPTAVMATLVPFCGYVAYTAWQWGRLRQLVVTAGSFTACTARR